MKDKRHASEVFEDDSRVERITGGRRRDQKGCLSSIVGGVRDGNSQIRRFLETTLSVEGTLGRGISPYKVVQGLLHVGCSRWLSRGLVEEVIPDLELAPTSPPNSVEISIAGNV